MKTKQFPFISIIVSAHNEEDYIQNTLKHIQKSKYPNSELIVICDACSDNTHKISKKFTDKVFDVSFKNVSKVRNFGAKKSKGNILIFFDADTIPSKNYFVSIIDIISNGFDFGCAKNISETKTFRGKFVTWIINRFNRKNKTVGGNCFVRKEFFNKINGFDDSLIKGEDSDFGDRLREKGAKYVFLQNSNLIPSERKFLKYGYFNYFSNLFKESLLYVLNKNKYKQKFKR